MASAAAAGGNQQNNNNNNGDDRRRRMVTGMTSPVSLATLANIYKRPRGRVHPQAISYFLDMHYPDYSWLLPGWVAEERVMDHGRVYRYYYDPEGKLYSSKLEVKTAWEKTGLIVIDK